MDKLRLSDSSDHTLRSYEDVQPRAGSLLLIVLTVAVKRELVLIFLGDRISSFLNLQPQTYTPNPKNSKNVKPKRKNATNLQGSPQNRIPHAQEVWVASEISFTDFRAESRYHSGP